jgi:hypothetical protein
LYQNGVLKLWTHIYVFQFYFRNTPKIHEIVHVTLFLIIIIKIIIIIKKIKKTKKNRKQCTKDNVG